MLISNLFGYDSIFIKPEPIERKEEKLIFEARANEATNGKIKCLVTCFGEEQLSSAIAKVFRNDLEFTDQLEIDLRKTQKQITSDIISKLFTQGVSIYCSLEIKNGSVLVSVYDTSSCQEIFKKKFNLDTNNPVVCGNKLSHEVLPKLTGDTPVSLYDLAYCELLNPRHKVIRVANYDAKFSYVAVPMKTVNIIPCWHGSKSILFYSQLTGKNTRLMAIDLQTNRHKVICSLEGLNMQPSVSKDGKKVVLCLSCSGNSELYFYDADACEKRKQRFFKKITNNGGNNVAPLLLENGDIIFCSDYKTGIPQIFYLNRNTNTIKQLTHGSYCAAPSYCEITRSVVFTRPVNGVFQLFRLHLNDDLSSSTEEQLTFNAGDKHDPSYSTCGKYVIFSYRVPLNTGHMTTQISALNTASGKIRVLTAGREPKSSPVWRKK